jgi:hypothetical protein
MKMPALSTIKLVVIGIFLLVFSLSVFGLKHYYDKSVILEQSVAEAKAQTQMITHDAEVNQNALTASINKQKERADKLVSTRKIIYERPSTSSCATSAPINDALNSMRKPTNPPTAPSSSTRPSSVPK